MKSKPKTVTAKAWALNDGKGNLMMCNCHPSKSKGYVIYKRKRDEFASKYWTEVEMTYTLPANKKIK